MILRDYQTRALAEGRERMREGHSRILYVAPTGSGKSVIASAIARGAVDRGRRVLWLVHRTELLDQAVGHLARVDLRADTPWGATQVRTIQACIQPRAALPEAQLIIFDEAHHAVAEEWAKIFARYPGVPVVGLTATPERSDGRGLGDVFTTLIEVATTEALTKAGHLVPCEILRPAKKLPSAHYARDPLEAYLTHAPGERCVAFVDRIAKAELLAMRFTDAGHEARAVSADTPAGLRRQIIEDFRAGKIRVLCNVFALTEGFDVPDTSVCILARGCGTAGTYLQMVGRVLRPSEGKTRALVLDLQGVSHIHGAPTDAREYTLDSEAAGIRLAGETTLVLCKVCGAVLEELPCESCGYAAEPKADQITGEALSKWEHLRAEPQDRKAARLAKWREHGARLGYKPGWANAKYKAVYGMWPR